MVKIAQVVCTYPPYRGGIGRVAFEYTERLRARGYDVHVFTPRYEDVKDDPKYVHRVPSPLHVGNAGVVPSLMHRLSGFDIVHLHYPFFGGAEPAIVGKALRHDQKLVMTYHHDPVVAGLRAAIYEAHRKLLFPWLVGRADTVLVSSREYGESSDLKEVNGALDRMQVMPFGVDLERFRPGREDELRKEFGWRDDVPVFLFVGGLDPAHHFKGLPVLIEALKGLVDYPWRCLVVGDGSMRASLEANANASGLGERMKFVGNASDEDLPRYYRMADVHCFPSTERAEAFGMVALEAAATGIPCIASDLPGVRSVVLNGETGLLVPPGDADELRKSLLLMLEQVDLRHRLGAAARHRAEAEFAWDPLMSKLEGVYRSL
ncbi:glycosyltransferase family 1 protein [bacterium]|nr:glycosyltransferase family 1 protein [bacterium]